jgi:molybdopterin molybdotransferase
MQHSIEWYNLGALLLKRCLMLSVTEARELILARITPVQSTFTPLQEAARRILAGKIIAEIDLPTFDNSSVDGFAVYAADLVSASRERPIALAVVGDIPAGSYKSKRINRGECMRIMTGAPMPAGADAVVMVEDTDFNFRDVGVAPPKIVQIYRSVSIGENIRYKGADIKVGQTVMGISHKLRAQDIGLLALLGNSRILTYRNPRVAILSTGDELESATEPVSPGKIRDANSFSLSTLAREAGADVINLGIAKDDPASIKKLLENAFDDKADLIISSAGVSVGAFDYVKSVVESDGSLDFWKVNMRPGKPLAFGQYRGIPFFGLPGNPVSAFIGFLVFIAPALEKLSGLQPNERPTTRVQLGEDIESDGRESYLRAVVTRQGSGLVGKLTGHQASSNLLSLVHANALLIIPSGVKSLPLGEEVDAWLF